MTDPIDAPLQREPGRTPDTAAMERGIKAACHAHFRHIPDAECRWPDCGHHRDRCVELAAIVHAALVATIAPDMVPRAECIAGIEAMAAEKELYRSRWLGTPEPAPKAEASDLERARQVVLDLTGRDPGEESAWGRVVATALAAVRREATSAGWDAAVKALRAEYHPYAQYGESSKRPWANTAANHLAANKPQDITLARDPVALLLAEAARLAESDDREDQRRARGLQDAAELLGSGK